MVPKIFLCLISFVISYSLSTFSMVPSKGLFFDVDGTLADSYKLGFDATQAILKNNGWKEIEEEEYHQGTRFSTPARFNWHIEKQNFETGELQDPSIGDRLGKEFDAMYVEMVSLETAGFYPGILKMLHNLNNNYNCQFAALSNACGRYVQRTLQVNNDIVNGSLFSVGLGADDVVNPKPYPDGLQAICNQLDLLPKDCIYVGDSPTDGEAALACGMKSIGCTWGSHSKESLKNKFDNIVNNVEELEMTLIDFIKN